MDIKFRPLTASDVECRAAQVTEKGVSLLLYKNARVDMAILDETVGPMGWQRHHLRENANCIISIWDDEKKQWIDKEDTGTESNTEAEKGLASDSFKRAGFNWGIGRELYTSPFIWIPAAKVELYDTGRKTNYGKPIMGCRTRFSVDDLVVESGKVTGLAISDGKGTILFQYGKTGASIHCDQCGKSITRLKRSDGSPYPLDEYMEHCTAKYGKILCPSCAKAADK